MNLWLLLLLHGSVVGVWGPLPYEMDTCQTNASNFIEEIDEKSARKPEVGYQPGDFTAECRISPQRPQLDPMPNTASNKGL